MIFFPICPFSSIFGTEGFLIFSDIQIWLIKKNYHYEEVSYIQVSLYTHSSCNNPDPFFYLFQASASCRAVDSVSGRAPITSGRQSCRKRRSWRRCWACSKASTRSLWRSTSEVVKERGIALGVNYIAINIIISIISGACHSVGLPRLPRLALGEINYYYRCYIHIPDQ